MSLSQKIAAALDAYADPFAPTGDFAVDDGVHRLSLSLTACGPVGLAFHALEFAPVVPPAADHSAEALRAWADRLCARVTYLMEPLVVLEIDTLGGEADLRSQPPTARGDLRSFYEMRLTKQGTVRLTRTVFDAATRHRRPAPCQMTREVLERLTDDLAACAG